MATFKIGDRVRITGNCCDHHFSNGDILTIAGGEPMSWELVKNGLTQHLCDDELELVQDGSAVVNFILQYELDSDPFEAFATMKEVEARIKELAKRSDLKRESIKVYEIAKTYDVKLETRVIFGPKVTLTEKPAIKKRSAKKRA